MTTIRKLTLLCALAAFLMINTLAPVARADEWRRGQDSVALEGNRGGGPRGGGGGRHGGGGGGRHHGGGGSGWAWAGFGAAVGLGIVSALTSDNRVTYVEPAPTVVYPSTTYYYYPTPSYTVTPTYPTAPTYVVPQPVAPAPYYDGNTYYYYR